MTMKQKAHTALASVVLASTFLLLAATLLHGTDFEASEAGLDNRERKVDLDVDANYDNEISIPAPDDPIEEDHGGIVVVGESDDIKIRLVPDSEVVTNKLEWTSNKIKVFEAETEVTSPYICLPPKTLSVRGEIASGMTNDVSMTLTSIPPGGVDAITYTVLKVEFDIDHACTTGVHSDSHDVAVDVTPNPLGKTLNLELKPVDGATGAAKFTNSDESTTTISGSTTLTVLGTIAGDVVSNMVMEVRLGSCVYLSNLFTVVDVTELTATDAENTSNTTNDTTQADDTRTLYLCQGTDGTAELELDLTWTPDAYPEDAFLWEIIPAGVSSGVAEWGEVTDGSFVDQPLTKTWDVANADGGVTNREFQVRAWFDCITNGLYDADEPHRIIDVTIIKVELARDIWGDKPLDDWPETSTQQRSPKYLFGNQEGIYVRVIGPSGLGNNYFKAQVTSESETSPVTIDLLEYAGSGGQSLSRNGTATPLRLGPETTTVSGAKYIKIVEEELLSFSITADGTQVCTRDVIVDRGEFATGTARSFDELLEPSRPPNRSPIWEDAADEFASDITDSWEADLDWWDVGSIRGTYDNPSANAALRCFIQQAGQNYLNHGEADLFYAQAHGDYFSVGNLLGTKKQAADPAKEELDTFLVAASDLAGIWNDDLDWAIIKSCSTLKHTGTGRARWEGALKNGRRAHGILGFEDPSASDYDGYVDDFLDEIGSGHTIITSWINGNTGLLVGDQPYGIVYHTENADDALLKAADGVSLTADMNNDNFSYTWRNTNGITGTDAALAGETEAQDFPVRWRGQMARRRVPVHKASGSFSVIRVKSWPFDVERLRQGFDLVREWDSGAVRLSRNIDLDLPAVSREEAIRLAREFINLQKLPGDAVLRDAAPIQASNEISPEGQTVAYALSFGHSTNGLDICGDTLRLIVQTDGVKLFAGMWHSAIVDNSRSIPLRNFNAGSLQEAVDWLSARYGALEALPDVEAVYPAYYVGEAVDGDARVVWRIQLKNGLFGLIDPAGSTKVVDYFKDDRGLRARRRDRK